MIREWPFALSDMNAFRLPSDGARVRNVFDKVFGVD